MAATIPFRYEYAKVGYGIKVPLEPSHVNGRRSFVPSNEDYFYTRAAFSDPPVIVVTFGQDSGMIYYRRMEASRCVA